MKIILNNNGQLTPLETVMGASVREGVNGEYTINFTTIGAESFLINDNTKVHYSGQYFNVISYAIGEYGKQPICKVNCEHISYSLNERVSDGYEYTGNITGALNIIFEGTPFIIGSIESTQDITLGVHGNTYRRTVLNSIAGLTGLELEYDGYIIHLRKHKGSVQYVNLLDTDNVVELSKNRDVLKNLTTYNLTLGRKTILCAGDNLYVKYDKLGINDYTRIIGIDYNPYDPFEVSIDVGDYVPDILDGIWEIKKEADDAKETANETSKKVETFDVRITDAEKTANKASSDVAEMILEIGKFEVRLQHTETAVDGMVSTIEAVILAEILDTTGYIKLFVEGKNYITQAQADGSYLKITNLNAGIETFINTATGQAAVVSAASSTYQKISDMGNYVLNNTLNTSIGQYIDSSAGIAKIVSAATGTFQKISDMGNYVLNSNLNTSIGQYINGATGQASIISAVTGTFQKISDMGNYVQTITLNTSIGQYIDGTTGTAKIISAVSGTYATISTTNSITQTVNSHTSSIALVVGYGKLVGTTGTVSASIIVEAINGAPSTVKISADHVNISGLVTITSLSTAGATNINGANITT
ncbi:MAG: hypothetical protein FWF15_05425, partial [Oscillospiraceae bacterium]|nr:hypothetical protein [Oscillospiraceae bacterium]